MEKKRKLSIIFVLLFVAGLMVFVNDQFSTNAAAINLNKLPVQVGEWKGRDYPPDERIMRILGTEFILDREYLNREQKHVYLSIVYYPDNKIGFHNPESCNTGAGSKIVKKDVYSLGKNSPGTPSENEFKVNRLVLERNRGDKVIFYFFVSGNYITNDYLSFRLHMMKQQMSLRRPSGAQVQIHSLAGPDMDKTLSLMEDFVTNLKPLLPWYLS